MTDISENKHYEEAPGGKVAVKVGMAGVVRRLQPDGSYVEDGHVEFDGAPAPVVRELSFAELSELIGEDEARKVFADHHQQGRVINN